MSSLWKYVMAKDAGKQYNAYKGEQKKIIDEAITAICRNPKGVGHQIGEAWTYSRKFTSGKWSGWLISVKYVVHEREVTITFMRFHVEKS